jgi:hypothetical protein
MRILRLRGKYGKDARWVKKLSIPITHQRIRFYPMLIYVKILLSKLSYKLFLSSCRKNYSQYRSCLYKKSIPHFAKNFLQRNSEVCQSTNLDS